MKLLLFWFFQIIQIFVEGNEINWRTFKALFPNNAETLTGTNSYDNLILSYLGIEASVLQQDLETIYHTLGSIYEEQEEANNEIRYKLELNHLLERVESFDSDSIKLLRRALTSHGIIAQDLLNNDERILLKLVIDSLTNRFYQIIVKDMSANVRKGEILEIIVYKLDEFIKLNNSACYLELFLQNEPLEIPFFFLLLVEKQRENENEFSYRAGRKFSQKYLESRRNLKIGYYRLYLQDVHGKHTSKLLSKRNEFDILTMIENWELEKTYLLDRHNSFWCSLLEEYVIYGTIFGPLPKMSREDPTLPWKLNRKEVDRAFFETALHLLKHVKAQKERLRYRGIKGKIKMVLKEILTFGLKFLENISDLFDDTNSGRKNFFSVINKQLEESLDSVDQIKSEASLVEYVTLVPWYGIDVSNIFYDMIPLSFRQKLHEEHKIFDITSEFFGRRTSTNLTNENLSLIAELKQKVKNFKNPPFVQVLLENHQELIFNFLMVCLHSLLMHQKPISWSLLAPDPRNPMDKWNLYATLISLMSDQQDAVSCFRSLVYEIEYYGFFRNLNSSIDKRSLTVFFYSFHPQSFLKHTGN